MDENFDFEGWGTRFNVQCSDGRVITPEAFKHNDGKKVSLIWNHRHDSPEFIVGHAYLYHRAEGMWAKGKFNDTPLGRRCKELLQSGDIESLSICANQLKQQGHNVMHGDIKELSLVIAGANPEAFIENVISHGEEVEDEAIIYLGSEPTICHADRKKEEPDMEDDKKKSPEEKPTDEPKPSEKDEKPKTIQDVIDTMTEEQRDALNQMVALALNEAGYEEDDENDNKEDKTMKHNAFDNEETVTDDTILTHADPTAILELAKSSRCGSLQEAIRMYCDENEELAHSFEAGADGIEMLFPEFKDVKPGAPELITRDQTWVSAVMRKVHKSPIARVRTRQADITAESNRAQGYQKGAKKKDSGIIKLLKRTTDPQTIYVKDHLDRDDILDIEDFDVVNYQYGVMRITLDEELAMAMMVGDGREDEDPDKISEEHVRSILNDSDPYVIHHDVDFEAAKTELQGTNTAANFGSDYIFTEAFIKAALTAREKYKGSGNPDMYIEPHSLNRMLLAKDMNGRRIYDTVSDVAKALNVGTIFTAEQFAEKTRQDKSQKTHKLLAIFVNMDDYTLGAVKGGQITKFQQFDINYNKELMLLETRVSGGLTRVRSAIVLEELVTSQPAG